MDSADNTSQLDEEPVLEISGNANSRSCVALPDQAAASYTANALASVQAVFHGSGIQHSGHGHFNVHGNINVNSNVPSDPKKEAEKCMGALFLTDPSEDRDMLKRKKGNRAQGTCEWIFHTKELNAWLHLKETEKKSQSSNILWLHGNPGTGKFTMAIFLSEKLSVDFNATENMTLAYFFCDASFENRKTATSIIRGLLYQLVQKHTNLLSKYIVPKYQERGDQLFTSFDALWAVFIAVAADKDTGRKYCIIDALDECDNESKDILLYQLYETFYYQGGSSSNLSILITSRPYPEIREYLQEFTNADLASFDEVSQDIDRCIKERVDDLGRKKHFTEKVKREITNLLRGKAEGTFLWVGLACEELRGKPSKDAIRFLREMPKGLTSLYRRLLNTAVEGETSEGVAIQSILSFVAVSFEALSLLSLSEACQLHQDEPDPDTRLQYIRDQIESCRLLVVVCDEKVQLLHQSVRDFSTGPGSDFFIERLEAHAKAASHCINNLIKRLHGKDMSEGPFLNYAKQYWTEHVREAEQKFEIHEPQIPFFETNSNSMWRWMRIYAWYPTEYTFLHVAVEFGLPVLVKYALGMREVHPIIGKLAFSIKKDVDPFRESHISPLNAALRLRHFDWKIQAEMVNMLLNAGAMVTRKDISIAVHSNQVDQEVLLSLLARMHPETRIQYIQQLLRERDGCENKFTPFILAKYGDQIAVEESAIRVTVSSSTGAHILPLLLDQRRGRIAISEDVMAKAAGNEEGGSELVEFLLKYQGYRIFQATQSIICAAMRNGRHGQRIIQLLCQHQSGKITITSSILQTAVIQEQEEKYLKILLQHRGDQPIITITAYTLAFGVVRHGRARDTLSFILKELGNWINFSDTMINAIKVLDGKVGFIEFLIQNGGAHILITDEVVGAVLDPNGRGYKYRFARMKLFFEHRRKLRFTRRALATLSELKHNEIGESRKRKESSSSRRTCLKNHYLTIDRLYYLLALL